MKQLKIAILLFNIALLSIIDYLYTLRAVSRGLKEYNPVMDPILHTPLFPLIKVVFVPLALLWAWINRDKWQHNWLINLSLWILFLVYMALTVWHMTVQLRLG
ncbi:MAG TPA: hypothetical protein DEF34_01435 [Desulfotomaculum sp.]|nr:MAG: hypothetical protein JL56_17150 [Desulfotomaculum sp. BICA1-6]HBX22288.1 hypothetical protein [Desulfotomaculum sp.]